MSTEVDASPLNGGGFAIENGGSHGAVGEYEGSSGGDATAAAAAAAAAAADVEVNEAPTDADADAGADVDANVDVKVDGTATTANEVVDEKSDLGKVVVEPPALPHVEINQLPLSLVIRNLTVFTIKEISQYMKTNVHVNQQEGSSGKKLKFLQLIIFLRNQFLKLYVLVKWCRTIKNNNFHTLIDLLNWFRTTNMSVNSCIWALKNNLGAMANAKLPNADLITALEVLSLGRPDLPTHNYQLSGEDDPNQLKNGMTKIPPKLILRRLYDLNLNVSIKISWMEFPEQFGNYQIKDGRIYITVNNEFELQLSTVDRYSPLFFVNLKFLFDNQNLPMNKPRLEKYINDLLYKSNKPLFAVYTFLHKYVLTLQLYMIHIELSGLENGGKFFGGNLVHRYDIKKSVITVKYWLNVRMGNRGLITIGIDKLTENLILRWENQNTSDSTVIPKVYTNILSNLESILDEIMYNHAHMIRMGLLSKGIFQEDEENSSVLLFQIPTTCLSVAPVQLKIDLISGIFYFKNPTPLLQSYAQQMNKAESAEELTVILQRLRLDKITQILRNMFEKTGWVCSKVVKLSQPIKTQFDVDKSSDNSSTLLQNDMFISLPKWPTHWYLILTIISSNSFCIVEKRIGKIMAIKGKWELKYLDESSLIASKLETITYQKIMNLQRSILHKIINHMIIDSLNQLKISNRVCSQEAIEKALPDYIISDLDSENSLDSFRTSLPAYSSIIALELNSLLNISNTLGNVFETSLFLQIDYARSEIKLYGKFKFDTMVLKSKCDELKINFIPSDPLAFYLCEKFTNLNVTVQYLTKFKKILMQLIILTDVVERLRKNFDTEHFKILDLKPNEVSFKYFKNDLDEPDCRINIITNDEMIENLKVELSPSNPQSIIQPFIDNNGMDYHFIFHYLQFTSSLFTTFNTILSDEKGGMYKNTYVQLGLHNLNEYQILYFNPETGAKIGVLIELKSVPRNGEQKVQYYVHFSDENISAKSPAYQLVQEVRNKVFKLDNDSLPSSRHKNTIRLSSGIACDANAIGPVLSDIHNILKIDSIEQSTSKVSTNEIKDAIIV
ncbi:hypothetical protein Kpol_1058p10 [Vanderwaltozyma polyspora DSM 70294]|uniref:Mediator of RNA polymerase II transcription subunit 14 n=1 Tax=Vanderwaltozyma polyspora (strain ATCC 22028 / DSM 70294 / BCRC 21397 / CBS 2163 / NBRC 10782 / NRRL Y-8283 / UCD 57-17) TaxID=436907 RepID=A7TJP4_VANPO|nr:uncharacterized protein Kpol_1058p10 [Vanderwaltozyma polyspora DSM 70294]EDO17473.1 hypothetical protein Kpol_1058p10 [Vanderwaltozyma polyspora DSM 70294]